MADLDMNESMRLERPDADAVCAVIPPHKSTRVIVQRQGPFIHADKTRVLLRRFYPSSHDIARSICERLLALSEQDAEEQLTDILDEFGGRHTAIEHSFVNRFREVRANVGAQWRCNDRRKILIGAHFMHEYSIESAALFNPSIVRHWDQSGLPCGACRFIISLRATGEGHISSVAFREGIVYRSGRVTLEAPSATLTDAKVEPTALINKAQFIRELQMSAGLTKSWSADHTSFAERLIFAALPDNFTLNQLRSTVSTAHGKEGGPVADAACQTVMLLGEANYTVFFRPDSRMAERVLFPSAPSQSNGIEDARFVQFTDSDGSSSYYATFTAYNGRSTLPQLMQTQDFVSFRFMTLTGEVTNKGMALFPRKIAGKYWMLSRQDDISVMIMSSNSLFNWENPVPLLKPERPFEIFKMGNCGSPLETPKGWLVITHGVGPMRRYVLGAAMLDIDNPMLVKARLPEPLLAPNEEEREGYVPNVVYTCGAMIHGTELVLPYAVSDSASSFASVPLESLYAAMGL